tara:strand:+ start:524 stop:763 length:240 start_codon:yes stop_codon:yes gene_type:complete
MSKDNVIAYIGYLETQPSIVELFLNDPDPSAIIAHASSAGFSFSEEDLKQALNARICNAESLPRPWGWPLARKFGLVRS